MAGIYLLVGLCKRTVSRLCENGGNPHQTREPIIHNSLSIIQCRGWVPQSVIGSDNRTHQPYLGCRGAPFEVQNGTQQDLNKMVDKVKFWGAKRSSRLGLWSSLPLTSSWRLLHQVKKVLQNYRMTLARNGISSACTCPELHTLIFAAS